jgi:hypothetical protein
LAERAQRRRQSQPDQHQLRQDGRAGAGHGQKPEARAVSDAAGGDDRDVGPGNERQHHGRGEEGEIELQIHDRHALELSVAAAA